MGNYLALLKTAVIKTRTLETQLTIPAIINGGYKNCSRRVIRSPMYKKEIKGIYRWAKSLRNRIICKRSV